MKTAEDPENLANARQTLESAKKDLRDAEEAVRREGGEIIPWPPDTTDPGSED